MYRFFIALLLLVTAGCVGEDRIETNAIHVENDGMQFAQVELIMSTGNLTLTGGAEGLFEGEFVHQISDYKPQYEFEVARERGHLVVEQPSIAQDTEAGDHYVTTMRLNNSIPLDLTYHKREGNGNLQLQGLSLNSLSLDLGEKDSLVDLSGGQPALANVDITSSTGADQIIMDGAYPALTALTIALGHVRDEILVQGSYALLEQMAVTTGDGDDQLTIEGAYPLLNMGDIIVGGGDDVIAVSGIFDVLPEWGIDVGAGADVIDLSGTWSRDMHFEITSAEDSVLIRLPASVGVIVEVANRMVTVDAPEFVQEEAVFTNSAYGQADVTLSLRLHVSTSEIVNTFTLELVDDMGNDDA